MASAGESAGAGSDSYSPAARILILRESLKMRCQQTAPAAVILLVGVSVIFVSLLDQVPVVRALLWLCPVLVGMGLRVRLTRKIRARLDEMTPQAMQAADRMLRGSSIVNQTLVGTGVWTLGTAGSNDAELFITFMITLYAAGAMINLATDYRSFRASLPFLLIQPFAYWSMQGLAGLRIALPVAMLGPLMMLVVKRSSKTFADSVAIRLEKNDLLEKVQAAHERAERALAVAEEANRSKAAFLAAASHDLRQPLFAISILAETLLLHDLPEAGRTVVTKQIQAIGILRSLFDNLLDLSKFEAGRVQAVCTPMLLSDVLEPLNAQFGPVCEAKGLAWRFSTESIPVLTDPELLGRLLGNLLSNAARYTDKGEVSLLVTMDGRRARIDVSDSGPGVAASDREKIFQEFVQLANPHRDRERGVGLGLAIVRRIDELLGTDLKMESALGSGTRFSVWVPLAQDAVRESLTAPNPSTEAPLPGSFKVWLIEDDPMVLSALALQFDAWGCQFRSAISRRGILELQAAEGGWPSAVILDDMLGPEDNGLDIARWLATKVPSNRILLVTGNVDPERIAQLQASGIAFMRKPMESEVLHRWLQSAASTVPAASC